MPIANGDVASNGAALNRKVEKLDWRQAVKVLETEYETRDGMDVHTLLNSSKNGALTYNDFLVLPGYIGMMFRCLLLCQLSNPVSQVSRLPKRRWTRL